MKTLRASLLALLAVFGVACGASRSPAQDAGSGLEPGVETFSAALGAGWSADSTSTASTLQEYVEASDAVVQARLIGVSEGPVLRVDEQPDSPTISFVYVRFQPVSTLVGTVRSDAASEIRIEYPRPPGFTAASLEELIPGEPDAVLFVADPRAVIAGFSVPHVYLAAGDAGVVVEGDNGGSPLVALANDEAHDANTAFGYATLSELRDAVAIVTEDDTRSPSTDPGGPGSQSPESDRTQHVFD